MFITKLRVFIDRWLELSNAKGLKASSFWCVYFCSFHHDDFGLIATHGLVWALEWVHDAINAYHVSSFFCNRVSELNASSLRKITSKILTVFFNWMNPLVYQLKRCYVPQKLYQCCNTSCFTRSLRHLDGLIYQQYQCNSHLWLLIWCETFTLSSKWELPQSNVVHGNNLPKKNHSQCGIISGVIYHINNTTTT